MLLILLLTKKVVVNYQQRLKPSQPSRQTQKRIPCSSRSVCMWFKSRNPDNRVLVSIPRQNFLKPPVSFLCIVYSVNSMWPIFLYLFVAPFNCYGMYVCLIGMVSLKSYPWKVPPFYSFTALTTFYMCIHQRKTNMHVIYFCLSKISQCIKFLRKVMKCLLSM